MSSSSSSGSSTLGWREFSEPARNFDCPYPPSRSSFNSYSPLIEKFSLDADPTKWGSNLSNNVPELDDAFHDPDEVISPWRSARSISAVSALNTACLLTVVAGVLGLFIAVPVTLYYTKPIPNYFGAYNLGGINASGQVPDIEGNWGLIDKDTPQGAYTRLSLNGAQEMQLVFSDEFNTDGRTFYPGDDPYWEAADLHYWGTENLEWYDPSAVTTANGSLVITLDRRPTHGLQYQGGFVSTWNKFCFTGGYIEASVRLPGLSDIAGYWPALWTMGNLGRAGYGATTEGMWPYSYDSCDVGTVANQSVNGSPAAASTSGNAALGGSLSFLPGQRLSRCTCPGESHPGPKHPDGTFVGRAAPEIDIFEASVDAGRGLGEVSQSAQWAPFDAGYEWMNTSDNMIIYDSSVSFFNTFVGTPFQEATSVLSVTDQNCYESEGGCFSVYAFEYKPGMLHCTRLTCA
ncbi:hypothetical protein AX16_002074 [Volvariella volvacea WC 439]|nr:hypothetical protein AX16_002074 [Volvariella volvacea WC 439]